VVSPSAEEEEVEDEEVASRMDGVAVAVAIEIVGAGVGIEVGSVLETIPRRGSEIQVGRERFRRGRVGWTRLETIPATLVIGGRTSGMGIGREEREGRFPKGMESR